MREKNVTNYRTRYNKLLTKLDFYIRVSREKLKISEDYGLPVNTVLEDFLDELEGVIGNEIVCD